MLLAGLNASPSMTSGAPSTTSAAPCAGTFDRLLDRESADRLHRHVDGRDDRIQFGHRAEALDHAALVEADVVNHDVDAEIRQPLRVGDAVLGAEVVAHHLAVEIAARVDDAPDRRFVRASHDDHEARAGLGHHLRFEIAAIHRLQIGDDRMIRKPLVKRLDGVEAFGEEQRRARFQPVDAGVDRDLRGLERVVEIREVERDLDDRAVQVLQVQRSAFTALTTPKGSRGPVRRGPDVNVITLVRTSAPRAAAESVRRDIRRAPCRSGRST